MIYLLALIGAVAVSYLVWKAFGPQPQDTAAPRRGPIGPDDDTDFLLDLDRDARGPRPSSGGPTTPPVDPPAPKPTPHEPRATDEPTDGAPRRDDPRPGAST